MSSSVTNQKLTAWNYVVKFVISSDKWKQNKTKRSGYSRVKPEQRNGTEGEKQILQSRNQKIYKNLKRKTIKPFKDPQLGSIEPLRHAVERRQLKHNPYSPTQGRVFWLIAVCRLNQFDLAATSVGN